MHTLTSVTREFWDAPEIAHKLGVHRATIHRWVKRGAFPAPIYLTPMKPVWADATYQAWLDERHARSGEAA